MLSDEEKQAIDSLKVISEYAGDNYLAKEHRRKLKLFIELVEKQSKEIEELREKNENLLDALNNSIDIKKYWVSKDKIKAKIEEVEKIIKEDREELNFGKTLRDDILQGIAYKIDFNTRLKNILESLLEKE